MSAATLTYEPLDDPVECGFYCGRPIMLLGAYVVAFDDGARVLIPHSGTLGTVGATPLPLDDPDVREALIAEATPSADALRNMTS